MLRYAKVFRCDRPVYIRTAHMNAYQAAGFIESFPEQVLPDIKNIDFASAVREAIRLFDAYESPQETKMSGAAYGRQEPLIIVAKSFYS